jgi:hypothetical protein
MEIPPHQAFKQKRKEQQRGLQLLLPRAFSARGAAFVSPYEETAKENVQIANGHIGPAGFFKAPPPLPLQCESSYATNSPSIEAEQFFHGAV